MTSLKILFVDASVASMSSSAIIPSEGEGGLKDLCDKWVEAALQRDFQVAASAFRASVANSTMARGAFVWAKYLAAQDHDLSNKAKSMLKKITMADALSADASLDALRFNVHAMAANVVARRNWEVDIGSQNRLVGVPFQGEKLFGQALDPILVESKDKKRILPSNSKKDVTKPKKQSFHFSCPNYRARDSQKSRSKWNRSSFPPKWCSQDGVGSNPSKTNKDQRQA